MKSRTKDEGRRPGRIGTLSATGGRTFFAILRRVVTALNHPPRWVEIAGWIVVLAVAAGLRMHLSRIVPIVLWSGDSLSYIGPAWQWLDTGHWQPSPIRGPVYTALLAFMLKMGGGLGALAFWQHLLGVLAIALAMLVLRLRFGRPSVFPLLLCGYAYAVQAQPLSREQFIGNETILLVFATVTLAAWFFALEQRRISWLWIAGAALGLLTMVKNVFTPLPLVIVAVLILLARPSWRRGITAAAIFGVAFALPLLGGRISKHLTADHTPPAPQEGLLLYGRTAQFTHLSGGIEPEIKTLIGPDIEAYRALPRLDNNVILHRTAIPRLEEHLLSRGQTHRDLNTLCRRLAFEAIRTHPGAYLQQVGGDLGALLFDTGTNKLRPTPKDVETSIRSYEEWQHIPSATARIPKVKGLQERTRKENFATYAAIADTSWLFAFYPVMLTTLVLPWLVWREKGARRGWWFGLLVVWIFTLVLLSTVGRPLGRYLTPVFPIMFWTLSAAVISLWLWLTRFLEKAPSPGLADSTDDPESPQAEESARFLSP